MAVLETIIGRGTAASKPATHYEGWLYYETDNEKWVRSNGTTWDDCEPSAGTGDVSGPATSTDNAIARYDGAGGDTLQDSTPLIDDSGNLAMEGGEIQDFTEEIVAANTGAAYEIDWETATLFELTLTDSPTFTFANLSAGRSITLILIQDATGSRTVTWPASVDWADATAPTLSTGAGDVDVITLFVRNDGTTVLGFEAGLDMG